MTHIELSWDLVERAKLRDTQAVEDLYTGIFQMALSYLIIRMGHTDEAEDFAQQTTVRIYKNLRNYNEKPGVAFKAVVFTVAWRLLSNHYRDMSRHNTFSDSEFLENIPSSEEYGGVLMDEADLIEELERSLTQLTANQQEIIQDLFFKQLSLEEVAKRLGKEVGGIKSARHRAIVALRKLMPDHSPI